MPSKSFEEKIESCDLLVIGGGINGAGVARDAAGRGLKVVLCEKDDLAQHTSSSSTKLIHGGLRYLENYDFSLVRHALREREVLLRSAPHIIWPMRFILPHHKKLRPFWFIRLGLFIYDHLGGRKMFPGTKTVDFETHVAGGNLKKQYFRGFEYSDCWVQDSRLVVLNVMDAKQRGADIRPRTECVKVQREHKQWLVTLLNKELNLQYQLQAKCVVNATGPWVDRTLNLNQTRQAVPNVRLVKGSHIVVPKLFDHDYPYIFQNKDGRVLFAIPFEHNFTLLGTTDIEVEGDPGEHSISESEISYICACVNDYLATPVEPDSVVWAYTGVRPLYDDAEENASKVTRDYNLHLDLEGPPILSIYGGKITTYRLLAEEVVDMLMEPLNVQIGAWTEHAPLPGGNFQDADFNLFFHNCIQSYPWMPAELLQDYVRNYGTLVRTVLDGCHSVADLGEHFGGLLYEKEVEYLVDYEWARSSDDILWRRSKKGLQIRDDKIDRLTNYLSAKDASMTA